MQEPKYQKHIYHKGRIKQIPIYLGKMIRSFIYQDDWKVIPMAAIIAGLVAFVAAQDYGKTVEGTVMGSLALTCICIWNGFFNSVQVVCRERDIVKREHRGGLHISSYIVAHMIYQALICFMQTIVTVAVCRFAELAFPTDGFVTYWFDFDIGITIFLVTYAADMMALALSCIARNTTAAMTAMPFMLIFELLFSGRMFNLGPGIQPITNLSIAKWGLNCMCAQVDHNHLPMITIWNQIFGFRDYEFLGQKPVDIFVHFMEENNLVDAFCSWCASNTARPELEMTLKNIGNCWINLLIFIAVFAIIALVALERIDKDKR